MIAILLIVGAVALFYYFAIKPTKYWSEKNVKTGKVIPVFGDNWHILSGREGFGDMVKRMYNKIPKVRYCGGYQFTTPLLIIRSPELIKQICVKDFDHFLNRNVIIPENGEEMLTKNLVSLKGQVWKNMRSTVSPSFTSSKMKSMFVFICQNAQNFTDYFLEKNENLVECEMKEVFTRYTNDVIASIAFGVQVDSLKDKDNEFYLMGRSVTNFNSSYTKLVFLMYLLMPKVANLLQISIIGHKETEFFKNIIRDSIKMREELKIKRADVLGLLLDARDGKIKDIPKEETKDNSFAVVEEHLEMDSSTKEPLSFTDIAAQVFVFFVAGFETVSTAMCFMAHELAANPDIQKKLIEEIDLNKPANGAPSYEVVMNMPYLDMVLTETLRKWPNAVATDRIVTKPYTIQPEDPEEQPVHLENGQLIFIPIMGIHHDPKYYENPEKFDPERFSPENRNKIDPYTYLPFGVGPRNCIGSRFALMEVKAVFFHLLSNFEIVPVKNTNIPLILSKKSFALTSENGFQLGLKKRSQI